MTEGTPTTTEGTCVVVMASASIRTSRQAGPLDLNLTYSYIIKPAVTSAGCIRADEIKHSGPIDVPTYEQLLKVDA